MDWCLENLGCCCLPVPRARPWPRTAVESRRDGASSSMHGQALMSPETSETSVYKISSSKATDSKPPFSPRTAAARASNSYTEQRGSHRVLPISHKDKTTSDDSAIAPTSILESLERVDENEKQADLDENQGQNDLHRTDQDENQSQNEENRAEEQVTVTEVEPSASQLMMNSPMSPTTVMSSRRKMSCRVRFFKKCRQNHQNCNAFHVFSFKI